MSEHTDITVYGDVLDFEHHLVAYGLAAMAEGSRLDYSGNRIMVRVPMRRKHFADTVHRHVTAAVTPDTGWFYRGAGEKLTCCDMNSVASVSAGQGGSKKAVVRVQTTDESGKPVTAKEQVPLRKPAAELAERRYAVLDDLYGTDPLSADVAVHMGRPQYWVGEREPSFGGTHYMPRGCNGGNDRFSGTVTAPVRRAKLHTRSGESLLNALENPWEGYLVRDTAFSDRPTIAEMVVVAMFGLWAVPTSVGVHVAARNPGAVYDVGRSYSHFTERFVLPVFEHPVSLQKVRGVISHKDWAPALTPVKTGEENSDGSPKVVFTYPDPVPAATTLLRAEQGVRGAVMWSPDKRLIGDRLTTSVLAQASL